jgi:hypothetical protein
VAYVLFCKYIWTADCCGNALHLDKVTLREYVTYEDEYTNDETHKHDWSHALSNAWSGEVSDPFITPRAPADKPNDPPLIDSHGPPQILGDIKPSQCHATQKVQWATAWPDPPSADDPSDAWGETIATYSIDRAVVSHDGQWWYQITKHGATYEKELSW